jgi:hypothetical protein
MEEIDIIILIIISFILGFLVAHYMIKKTENLINLDDSRKIELSKCCTNPTCYQKPPYLRENCNKNKEESMQMLDKQFDLQYTQEEYYKKLQETGVLSQINNVDREAKYVNEMNEELIVNKALNEKTFNKIIKDDRDEVRPYDVNDFAPYK